MGNFLPNNASVEPPGQSAIVCAAVSGNRNELIVAGPCGPLSDTNKRKEKIMGVTVTRLYRRVDEDRAYCFNVESTRELISEEMDCLRLILADGFLADSVRATPFLQGQRVVEVGPRLNFATAWSSNMVSICRATGLDMITRVERSRRYLVPPAEELQQFIDRHHDRMTECHYPEPLSTFITGIVAEAVYEVDLKGKGPDGLNELPGISWMNGTGISISTISSTSSSAILPLLRSWT